MSGAILRKTVNAVACDEWGWVDGRVFGFYNLDVNEISELGSGVSARTLGSVAGAEEGSDINMMTNEISKEPSKSVNIYYHLVTSVNNSEMITQKFLFPATNHQYCPFIF